MRLRASRNVLRGLGGQRRWSSGGLARGSAGATAVRQLALSIARLTDTQCIPIRLRRRLLDHFGPAASCCMMRA